MPAVEVGLHVAAAAAGRVVLDEPRRVERLREVVARLDPRLRLGQVAPSCRRSPFVSRPHCSLNSTHEKIAGWLKSRRSMPRSAVSHSCRIARVGLAPGVRHVAHHQHAEPVGPVELARQLDLHVRADRVQAQAARDQDLLAHRLVARPGREAVGMPALVERHLQVDRRAVERHVGVAEARQRRDADLAQAEVALDAILAGGRGERERRVVEVRVVERPQARARPERQREARLASARGQGLARLGERRDRPRLPWARAARAWRPAGPGRSAGRAARRASARRSGGTRTSPGRARAAPPGRPSATGRAPSRTPACPPA